VVQFLRTVRTPEGAELRIDKLARSQLGTEIAQLELADLLQADAGGKPTALRDIGQRVVKALAGLKDEAGIEVVDVQIRRLNLPEGNRAAVYARQKSERQRIANKYRAEGQAEAKKIASQAQRESEAVLSQAYAEGQAIRGAGEAQAAETYATAYGRDPEFFRLLRTLQAYEEMLGSQATLILSANSPLFRLFREGPPGDKAAAPRGEPAPTGPVPPKPTAPGVTRKP
jgi:membrane protease subunit HflC